MIKFISTLSGHQPIGHYSQAVVANGFIFCSGTAGVDPKTKKLVDGLENQIRQIFTNFQGSLKAAGSDLKQTVKVTVFLKNMADFKKMDEVYKDIFGSHLPARTVVAVSDLAKKDALIVAELIALAK